MHLKFLLIGIVIAVSSGARPKPAYDCDDDKPDPRYHNQSCDINNDCFGHLMECKEGKCQCKEDAIPQERFVGEKAKQMICDRAPGLNEKCETTCRRPLTCAERSDSSGKKEKVCVCKEPFKAINDECSQECKEDETYDRSKFLCRKRCRANEVDMGGECQPESKLDGTCVNDRQCIQAYSNCKDGRCSCLEGFNNENGQCQPQTINCPAGSPLLQDNKPIPCRYSREKDTCPAGGICFTSDTYRRSASAYCCPEEHTKCPVGLPDNRYSCSNDNNTCPYASHYCHQQNNIRSSACCPNPCKESDSIFQDGKCYSKRAHGDFCSIQEQCPSSGAECKDGRCQCREGYTQKGNSYYRYCDIDCKKGEVLNNEKCHKRLSLGDNCENQAFRCPQNSFCNKLKVCACRCPYFTLAKDLCAPLPRCPGLKTFRPYYGRSGMAGLSMESQIKGYQPISDVDKQKVLENVTFCATGLPADAPSVDSVPNCDQGKYCASYIQNLGMCCKLIDTVCPNGKPPAERKVCQRSEVTSCGTDQFCYDFLYTADPESKDGKMCCPRAGLEVDDD